MKLFDGLYLYEVVLMILGVVLFIAVLVAFLRQLFRGGAYGGLLGFFVVPIVMIGYPSIKSIEINKDLIKIEKVEHDLRQDPASPALRSELSKVTTSVADRPISGSSALATISTAQFALGQDSAAENNVAKALRADPSNAQALDLKRRIELANRLAGLVADVEKQPNNTVAKEQLATSVKEATTIGFANPKALATVAHAQLVLGHDDQALKNAEVAIKIDPTSTSAKHVVATVKAKGGV